MKKIISLFIGLSAILTLGACSSFTKDLLKDPEVEVTSLGLEEVTTSAISLRVKLNVKNPNAIPLKIGRVDYALNFDGEKVTNGTVKDGIDIPANGENSVEIPLTFGFNSLGNVVKGFFTKDYSKPYKLSGTAQIGVFAIPFNKEGELKLK